MDKKQHHYYIACMDIRLKDCIYRKGEHLPKGTFAVL